MTKARAGTTKNTVSKPELAAEYISTMGGTDRTDQARHTIRQEENARNGSITKSSIIS
jgi:hypothetical protein